MDQAKITFKLAVAALLAASPIAAVAHEALLTSGKINDDRDSLPQGAGGRQPYTAVPAGYGPEAAKRWADSHRAAHGTSYRYVYIPADKAGDSEAANTLRVAVGKAWNHLSWLKEIDVPEDASEGAGLVLALNIDKVWGPDAARNWGFVAGCTAKAGVVISPSPRGDCASFGPDEPVPAPRFVFNATHGGPYANIHKTPPFYGAFARKYKLGPIKYTSTHKEAIVCGPRITAYRMIDQGGQQLLYSFSTDEFVGRDGGAIRYRAAPTERDQRNTGALNAAPGDGQTAVASEWWIQMPNGFMYYGIHGEGSQERGKAEFPFAVDPANWKQGGALATGRSCITCHANGVQSAPSDAEFAGRDGWTSNAELTTLYDQSRGKFQAGMRRLVEGLSDASPAFNERMVAGTVEPVSKAIALVEGPYTGGNSTCRAFCRGKFGAQRRNFCDTMPTR